MRKSAFALRFSTIGLLVLLLGEPVIAQQVGRLSGKVRDSAGEPIEGVEATLIATEGGASYSKMTNKKGKFVLSVRDASQAFEIQLVKEGFATVREPIQLRGDAPVSGEWELQPGTGGAAALNLTPEEAAQMQAAVDAYNAAVAAFNADDLETAATQLETAIAENPELDEAYQLAAVTYTRLERHDRAVALADQLLARTPDNEFGLLTRYDSLNALGDERAGAALDQILEALPNEETAKRAYNMGRALALDGDHVAAIPRIEQALAITPDLRQGWGLLGDIAIGQQNFARALECGEKLVAIDGAAERGHSLRHRAFEAMGDEAGAKVELKILAELNPDAVLNSLFERGKDLFEGNKADEAAAIFRQVLELQPENASAHYELGLALLSAGDAALARTHLQKFLDLDPEHPQAASAREMIGFLE